MTAELPSEIALVWKSCRKRNNNRKRSYSRIEESYNNRKRSFEESFDELQCEYVVHAKWQETKHYNHYFICNEKKQRIKKHLIIKQMFNGFFQRKYFKLYEETSFEWAKQSL